MTDQPALAASDPWGSAEPALTAGQPVQPLPPRLALLAGVDVERELDPDVDPELVAAVGDGSARAEELPEVAALAADRWRPLEPAPVYVGVPAVWPAHDRGWVPDRLPGLATTAAMGGRPPSVLPSDPDQQAEYTAAWAEPAAAELGLPAPPRGRIWLLRSPWPQIGVEVLLTLGNAHGHRTHPDAAPHVALYQGLTEVLSWTETELWAWWDDPDGPDGARCARAWLAGGRGGESSAALVLAHLFPDDLDRLTAPLEHGGAGLTEEQAVAWTQAAGSVERVVGWRQLGLAEDPPLPAWRLRELDPAEVSDWLVAGFTVAEVDQLHGLGLDRARAWRTAGFPAGEVEVLLRADPTLSPAEAAAFTTAGLSPQARRSWVAAGFDAADARAYTDLDIYPGEARVWRATGRSPADARAHRDAGGGPLPNDSTDIGWFAYGTTGDRAQRSYQISDPEGTRGRTAHEQRERERRSQ